MKASIRSRASVVAVNSWTHGSLRALLLVLSIISVYQAAWTVGTWRHSPHYVLATSILMAVCAVVDAFAPTLATQLLCAFAGGFGGALYFGLDFVHGSCSYRALNGDPRDVSWKYNYSCVIAGREFWLLIALGVLWLALAGLFAYTKRAASGQIFLPLDSPSTPSKPGAVPKLPLSRLTTPSARRSAQLWSSISLFVLSLYVCLAFASVFPTRRSSPVYGFVAALVSAGASVAHAMPGHAHHRGLALVMGLAAGFGSALYLALDIIHGSCGYRAFEGDHRTKDGKYSQMCEDLPKIFWAFIAIGLLWVAQSLVPMLFKNSNVESTKETGASEQDVHEEA